MYAKNVAHRLVFQLARSRTAYIRWNSTLPPTSIFSPKPSAPRSSSSHSPPKSIPSPPRVLPSKPIPKETKVEIKQSSRGPVAPKIPEKVKKEEPKEAKEGKEKDVEELRDHIKATIPEEKKPETPIDQLYEKYIKDEDENAFLTTLLGMKGYIAIDPKESNTETLAYIYAEHPSFPKAQFVPVFETEERLNRFYGKDHQFVSSDLPFDMIFTGLNGLGLMINPTSPYNFTLQWSTVQAIGQMIETRRENEQAAVEDDSIETTGNLELVEGMESERQKYIDLLQPKLEYFPEIVRAFIELVREVPNTTQNEEEPSENKPQTHQTQQTNEKTETQTPNKETIQNETTNNESTPQIKDKTKPEAQQTTVTETDTQTRDKNETQTQNKNEPETKNKTETETINTETVTEIQNNETVNEIQSGEPHPLVIIEVSEETSDKLFRSIVKQLVKGIEDSAPAQHLDVARYVPDQHDEFLGDSEPFYYGLFQKPKTAKFVKAPLPFQPARKRVGRVSSTTGKVQPVSKGGKKK